LAFRPMSHRNMCTFGWLLIELAAAVIIYSLVTGPRTICHQILSFRPLVWIGKVSYGLYLWHFPIFSRLQGTHAPEAIKTFAMFASAFIAAAVSYHLVEKRFLKLKDHFKTSEELRLLSNHYCHYASTVLPVHS